MARVGKNRLKKFRSQGFKQPLEQTDEAEIKNLQQQVLMENRYVQAWHTCFLKRHYIKPDRQHFM